MAEESKTRAFRLPPSLNERVEQYKDEQGMTASEALRDLVRSGLDSKQNSRPNTPLRALLYDAAGMKHRALVFAAVFVAVFALVSLPLGLEVLFLVPAAGYALTAVVGFLESLVLKKVTAADRAESTDSAAADTINNS